MPLEVLSVFPPEQAGGYSGTTDQARHGAKTSCSPSVCVPGTVSKAGGKFREPADACRNARPARGDKAKVSRAESPRPRTG